MNDSNRMLREAAYERRLLRAALYRARDHLRHNAWKQDPGSDRRFKAVQEVDAALEPFGTTDSRPATCPTCGSLHTDCCRPLLGDYQECPDPFHAGTTDSPEDAATGLRNKRKADLAAARATLTSGDVETAAYMLDESIEDVRRVAGSQPATCPTCGRPNNPITGPYCGDPFHAGTTDV
jgi:hypothetical protein